MIYFLIYLLLEVFITINLGGTIGIVATFIEIVFTFLLGLFYIMNFKYSMVETLSQVLKQRITKEQFIGKNLTSFLGAVLLILPGFLSDILGILLQFSIVSSFIVKIFFKNINFYNNKKRNNNDNIIDVEIKDNNSNN